MGEGESGRGAGEFKEEVTFELCFEALCDSHLPAREEGEVIPGSGAAWPTSACMACHGSRLRSQQHGV